MKTFHVVLLTLLSVAGGLIACTADSTSAAEGPTGTSEEALCINPPCTTLISGGTSGKLTSGGVVVVGVDPGPTPYSFTCKGKVPGHPGYYYTIVPSPTDPNTWICVWGECPPGFVDDGSGHCGGLTPVANAPCTWPGQTTHCDRWSGTCSCY